MANKNNEHIPNETIRQQVSRCSAFGMSQENVAKFVGLSTPTLMKHYRHEYENGNELMLAELMPKSMQVALDIDHKDSSQERRFLMERKGGFIKTENHNVSGEAFITNVTLSSGDKEADAEPES